MCTETFSNPFSYVLLERLNDRWQSELLLSRPLLLSLQATPSLFIFPKVNFFNSDNQEDLCHEYFRMILTNIPFTVLFKFNLLLYYLNIV